MTDKIRVEVDRKWVRRLNSPLFWVFSALTAVSISSAPCYLYKSGQGKFPDLSWWLVPVCFAIIWLVPLFYIRLAGEVVASIYKQTHTPRPSRLPQTMRRMGRLARRMRPGG